MLRIEFTPKEADVLRDLLQHEFSQIDVEVFRTDAYEFKHMLKERREILERILTKLRAVSAAV